MQFTGHNAAAAQGVVYTGPLPHATSGPSSANLPVFSLPIEDPANPFWDGEKTTENAQRDPRVSLGQQAYAPAGSNMVASDGGR